MDIVILADFCGTLLPSSNNRFIYLANILSEHNDVEIITSDFRHNTKTYIDKDIPHYKFKITFLHEPSYDKNVCLKRFYSHYVWGNNVSKYLEKRKKPDVIYCALPTLKASKNAVNYCKKNNVRFIIDIQDLWPEAFKMVFNVPVLSDLIFAPLTAMANAIYKQADEIIAVSDTYCQRALKVNEKCKKAHTIFLGTNLDTFDKNATNTPILSKNDDELWLAYCGTLGSSYDLTNVFDALNIIKKQGIKPPKFIIMGSGPRKQEFEEYANNKNIDCVFTDRLPYDQMCALLCECDITINPITHNAAQSIINKHADYAASGLPVISTQECKEYIDLVNQYNMGFNCQNGNEKDVAEKIIKLINDKELRCEMGKNARRCAEEKFDRKNSYNEIIDIINIKQQ